MFHPDLPVLNQLVADAPLLVRLVVGVLGVIVLAWGARIYRPALLMASFGAGAVATVAALHALTSVAPALARAEVILVAALLGGAALAGIAAAVHRMALVALGGLAGLVLAGAVAGVFAGVPWWMLPIGAVVGAVALPLLYQSLLKITMPLVGAVLVSWAVGLPFNAVTVVGLWVVGALFQVGVGRGEAKEEEER